MTSEKATELAGMWARADLLKEGVATLQQQLQEASAEYASAIGEISLKYGSLSPEEFHEYVAWALLRARGTGAYANAEMLAVEMGGRHYCKLCEEADAKMKGETR